MFSPSRARRTAVPAVRLRAIPASRHCASRRRDAVRREARDPMLMRSWRAFRQDCTAPHRVAAAMPRARSAPLLRDGAIWILANSSPRDVRSCRPRAAGEDAAHDAETGSPLGVAQGVVPSLTRSQSGKHGEAARASMHKRLCSVPEQGSFGRCVSASCRARNSTCFAACPLRPSS